MIIKDSTVKIDNLHSILKELIPELDALHKEFTGNPLVITSGNDDVHWGGIKEKNRPFGWQDADEGMVRTVSDSAHYLDEAFDFRKKCPYSKMKYYANLSLADRDLFLKRAREIFIKQKFDVVECAACLHVEWDPKWTVDVPGPRIKSPVDYKIPEVPESPPMPKPYSYAWYKFYKKNGFKRILGGVTLITGGVLSLIPATSAIGQGVLVLGGVIESVGIGHAGIKKRAKAGKLSIWTILHLLWATIKQTYFNKKEK